MKVAIDGPAGSGKSTVARKLSQRLGLPYLNTGLIYRAFAYIYREEGPENPILLFENPPLVEILPAETRVFYKGKEISQLLGSEDVGKTASEIASLPAFRERINEFFRSLVGEGQVVAEGRDVGTHIFPDAPIKIFLTASAEERARRRCEQLMAQGIPANYQEVLRAIVERDERDKNRPLYPFRPAEDAIVIDTTSLSPEEVVEKILSLVKERV